MENELSLSEKLLNPECEDDITLTDEEGNEIVFEQAAVIPRGDKVYVILSPITEIDGVEPGTGLVFELTEVDDEDALVIVTDDKIVDDVFEVYEALCEEE